LSYPQAYPAFLSTGVIAVGTGCDALMVSMQPYEVSEPRGHDAWALDACDPKVN